MFQSETQKLIDVWTGLPGGPGAPSRAVFDAHALGLLLPRAFSMDLTAAGLSFRTVGGWIEAQFERPLAGESWLNLWTDDTQYVAHQALVAAVRNALPVVVTADVRGVQGELEMAIAPLSAPSTGRIDRLLGMVSGDLTGAVGGRRLSARSFSLGQGREGRGPVLATLDGRRVA